MRECESATANLLKYILSLAMLFVVVNNISQQDEKIRQNLFLKLLSRLLGPIGLSSERKCSPVIIVSYFNPFKGWNECTPRSRRVTNHNK